MKLYFAAPSNRPDNEAIIPVGHKYMLFSYHYYSKWGDIIKEHEEKNDCHSFVDSGAFSAYTKGVEIDIDEYAKWLIKQEPKMYATLDAIGDPIKTLENTKYLEREYNLNPLPVFHMRTEEKYLYDLLDYDYICLGGMVKSQNLDNWLELVWNIIMKEKPSLKVHGFGLTGKIVQRYPFHSIDSSSWANGVRFANVTRFNHHKNKLYDTELWKYCREVGIKYEKGQSIIGWYRNLVVNISCNAHIQFNEYITKLHEEKDFSYLTNQIKLF